MTDNHCAAQGATPPSTSERKQRGPTINVDEVPADAARLRSLPPEITCVRARTTDSQNRRLCRFSTTGTVSTVAGSGVWGSVNGTGTAAQFKELVAATINRSTGMVYTLERSNFSIRQFDPSTGAVTTVAGTGVEGNADGPAATATKRLCVHNCRSPIVSVATWSFRRRFPSDGGSRKHRRRRLSQHRRRSLQQHRNGPPEVLHDLIGRTPLGIRSVHHRHFLN
jgi:hypothetical protein